MIPWEGEFGMRTGSSGIIAYHTTACRTRQARDGCFFLVDDPPDAASAFTIVAYGSPLALTLAMANKHKKPRKVRGGVPA